MPPRAAETNEPDTLVGIGAGAATGGAGAATGGAGGPGGAAGPKGPGSAGTRLGSSSAPNVQIPAAPATALAPRRRAARRDSSGTSVIMPRRQRYSNNRAVSIAQRIHRATLMAAGHNLVQSTKYVTLFNMTELSESSAGQTTDALPLVFRTVYGSDDDNTGQQVRDFHHQIKGEMPSGDRYHALDPDTYFWAHATFVEQVLYFADTFVKRLTDAEKEQIYLESKTWYRRYGVSDRPMPANYAEFERYWDRMMNEIVVAHPTAKYGVGYVTKGFPCPKGVSPAVWRVIALVFNPVAAFLTTGGLPPRARALLGLPWSERQERHYRRFAAFWRSRPVNWVWEHLPMRLRYNGYALKG